MYTLHWERTYKKIQILHVFVSLREEEEEEETRVEISRMGGEGRGGGDDNVMSRRYNEARRSELSETRRWRSPTRGGPPWNGGGKQKTAILDRVITRVAC